MSCKQGLGETALSPHAQRVIVSGDMFERSSVTE